MAVSDYDKKHLSASQQATIDAVTKAAESGSMSWADAHSAAEAVRAQAGYSGGQDGSGYTPASGGSSGGNVSVSNGSSYTSAPKYTSGSVGGVSWDGDTDYSVLLQNAMDAGNTNADWLQSLLDSRIAKASYNPSLNQYANDDFAKETQAYIDALLSQEQTKVTYSPSYSGSQWDNAANQAANQYLNMNYEDWTQGDQYKALADRFGIQGKMTMQDVLGQISSRTGGLASSYATAAAQQQYNEWMSQLEEVARQMYAGERSDLLDNAQLAQSLGDRDYNRYLGDLDRYYADRDYQYQVGRDAVADAQWDKTFDYNASRDQISDSRYDQEYADSRGDLEYERNQITKSEAKDRINAYLAAYGSGADLDPALVETSGYTPAELAALEKYYADQKAAEAAAANKSTVKDIGGPKTGKFDLDTFMGLATEQEAYAYLMNIGADKTETETWMEYWKDRPVEDTGEGMQADHFRGFMRSIQALLESDSDEAEAVVASRLENAELSEAQLDQLRQLLGRYGLDFVVE